MRQSVVGALAEQVMKALEGKADRSEIKEPLAKVEEQSKESRYLPKECWYVLVCTF